MATVAPQGEEALGERASAAEAEGTEAHPLAQTAGL